MAVISEPLWHRRFGGAPVLGRQILVNRVSYTIVGVADRSLVGSFVGAPIDVWIPIRTARHVVGERWASDRTQRELSLIGRLRPGVTRARAQQDVRATSTCRSRSNRAGA